MLARRVRFRVEPRILFFGALRCNFRFAATRFAVRALLRVRRTEGRFGLCVFACLPRLARVLVLLALFRLGFDLALDRTGREEFFPLACLVFAFRFPLTAESRRGAGFAADFLRFLAMTLDH